MKMHLTPLRGALALLLFGSAILFVVGSTIERSHKHHEATPTAAATTGTTGGGSATEAPTGVTGGEAGSGGETHGETTGEADTQPESAHSEAAATLLGIDTESVGLSIVAAVLSILLAAALLTASWPRLVPVAVAGFSLVFAAADARELVHQLDDSSGGLAAVAGLLIALHLAVAMLATVLARREAQAARPPLAA